MATIPLYKNYTTVQEQYHCTRTNVSIRSHKIKSPTLLKQLKLFFRKKIVLKSRLLCVFFLFYQKEFSYIFEEMKLKGFTYILGTLMNKKHSFMCF